MMQAERIVKELREAATAEAVRALFQSNAAYQRLLDALHSRPLKDEELMRYRADLLRRAEQLAKLRRDQFRELE